MKLLEILSCAILLFGGTLIGADENSERPNVVLFLADDMGWGDPQCYNPESKVPTPNIDLLAAEGMLFTDGHSSGSTCSPSRYALMTGRHACRLIWDKGPDYKKPPGSGHPDALYIINDRLARIPPERLTLPQMLKAKGYETALIGKWHLGYEWAKDQTGTQLSFSPNNSGFDYYFGIVVSANVEPYCFFENDTPLGNLAERSYEFPEIEKVFRGLGTTDWHPQILLPGITRKAVQWLRERKNNDRPFFLEVAFSSPHTPIVPTDPFLGTTQAGPYGDFVRQTDDSVGRIYKALEASGHMENTIIIFTSDNGSPAHSEYGMGGDFNTLPGETGHHPSAHWRGIKGTAWEGGHRVPFIVKWPGEIVKGSRNDHLVCISDIMATMADITGYELPNGVAEDSLSLLREWTAPGKDPVRDQLLHHTGSLISVRQGDWKIIFGLTSGWPIWHEDVVPKSPKVLGQLYNLKDDPGEKNNLWATHPEKVRELAKLRDALRNSGRTAPRR